MVASSRGARLDALLYEDPSSSDTSDESDVDTAPRGKRAGSPSLLAPGWGARGRRTRTPVLSGVLPMPLSSSGSNIPRAVAGNSVGRFTLDPLGPLRSRPPPGPALVPEGEEGTESVDPESGCPIRDNWLVDDLGEGSPSRGRGKRRRDLEVERESRALLGLPPVGGRGRSSSSASGTGASTSSQPRRLGRGRGSAGRKVARPGVRSVHAGPSSTSKEATSVHKPSGGNTAMSRKRLFDDTNVSGSSKKGLVIKVSDEEEGEEEEEKEGGTKLDGAIIPPPEKRLCNSPATFGPRPSPMMTSQSHGYHPPYDCRGCAFQTPDKSAAATLPLPLCIRVCIENSTYYIPCPAKMTEKGSGRAVDTPISWLMAQASERFFSEHEQRPLLRLTKLDGASLYPGDAVSHVLSQDEVVRGVVKEWVCQSLGERYRKECKSAGQGEGCGPGGVVMGWDCWGSDGRGVWSNGCGQELLLNRFIKQTVLIPAECCGKVLSILEQGPASPSALDLSGAGLTSLSSIPLLQVLQEQHSLSSLSLASNRLQDEGMPRLLAAVGMLPALVSLDLSANCITHRVCTIVLSVCSVYKFVCVYSTRKINFGVLLVITGVDSVTCTSSL